MPASSSRLLPGTFASAEQTNLETLLRLDVDRLLVPFLREAGIPTNAASYGGWESDGLDGHAAGHVLSALSWAVASTGEPRARRMLERLVAGLHATQTSIGSGYLGGVPNGIKLWSELTTGDIRATPFELNGRWVPLYNLHKTLAGLLDVVDNAQVPLAEATLDRLADWWLKMLDIVGDEALERILTTEFGGLTDAFARVASRRKDPRFLQLAMRFANRSLLQPLLAGADALDGVHANTRIPVVAGYATIARVGRELGLGDSTTEEFGRAARNFFDAVTRGRSTAIGGNSVREHFPPRSDFSSVFLAREGPESCNTINMIQLAAELYRLSGEDDLLDFIETAHVNHVLSIQHPSHGGIVYFTSHRPTHYRVYSPEQAGFWCCMLSGLQAHAAHSAHTYATAAGEVRVIQMLPSELELPDRGLSLRQESEYPSADRVQFEINSRHEVPIAIRIPAWARNVVMRINGGRQEAAVTGSWWRHLLTPGQTLLELSFTREIGVKRSPDNSAWGWIRRGPTVLAQRIPDPSLTYVAPGTRTGHIASGPLLALAETPVIPADPRLLVEDEQHVTLWAASGEPIELEPFAAIHDARYRISWPLADNDPQQRTRELKAIDRNATAFESRVIDSIAFGEQQPESDHELQAYDSEIGLTDHHRWRYVHSRIAMKMTNWGSHATSIRIDWLEQTGSAAPNLIVDGVQLRGHAPGRSEQRGIRYQEFDLPEVFASSTDLSIAIAAGGGEGPRLVRLALLTENADRISDEPNT